jgi:hypothetical protein
LCGHNLRTLFARFKIIKRRSIDDIITRGATAIGVLLGIIAVVMFIVFMWEVARSAYFAAAAKWYGWSKEEKFEQEMAREERRWAQEERNAKIDGIVAGDVVRRRHGVNIATFAIAGLAFQLNLPVARGRDPQLRL